MKPVNESNRRHANFLFVFFFLTTCSFALTAQQHVDKQHLLRETSQAFFQTEEARRIGDQLLLYQRATGGWPKNIDMTRELSGEEREQLLKEQARRDDSTIDNNATTMQMTYLARLYQQTGETRYRDAFRRGIDYLLNGQYDNGGWPQFWPETRGYQVAITYNDDAIVNILFLFRDMMNRQSPYEGNLVDEELSQRLSDSFNRAISCILKTQIIVDGQPTIWCQQHDRETLLPTYARSYELPSYCSQESAAIVDLLMSLPHPDASVKKAITGAMKWFDTYKLTGLRYERGVMIDGERTVRLVEDPEADPIWARFYDLEKGEPFVCDRDGIPRKHLEEIGSERRNGYSWYNNRPAKLYPLYDKWRVQYDWED
ncbi:PelA/Pel-15E family pectate lyase [Parabacteroides sp. PFB2-10]|nr:PelA/Pel-15E family pectate lyase [Parabacteroides sp. PFB2-10]